MSKLILLWAMALIVGLQLQAQLVCGFRLNTKGSQHFQLQVSLKLMLQNWCQKEGT